MTIPTALARETGDHPAALLDELRELTATAPARARLACWDHVLAASAADDRELLDALFAAGTAPELHGDYEGIVAGKLFGIPALTLLNPVVAIEPGWVGKSFDADTGTGANCLNRLAYLALRAAVPGYRGWVRTGSVYRGFRFTHRIEKAILAPHNQVVAVTYTDPALGNPGSRVVPMERVRDEIVELVPGVYLGRAQMISTGGVVRAVGYFAMRAPRPGVRR